MSTALENTFKSKVTIVIMLLFACLLFVCGFMSLMIYQGTSRTQTFFNSDAISASYYEINEQSEVNNKLLKISNDKGYDINHAYVEVNPYKNSPLSGIIIFYTKDEEQIRVYVNNKYVTTMEASKKHIIPIYGLLSDTDNTIRVESSREYHDYTMHTDKVEVNKDSSSEDFLFVANDNIVGYDEDGNARFYLSNKYSNDITWLSNDHFITGISSGSSNNHYNGFVEMDYLGKIYNYYILRDGYSGSIGVLPNGNMVTLGLVNNEYIIYTFDPRSGDVKSQIDMYGLVKGIDDSFDDKYLNGNTIYNKIIYRDNLLYVANDSIVFVFDIDNKRLMKVYSIDNIFDLQLWAEYYDSSISGLDLSLDYNHDLYNEVTDNTNINYLKSINNKDPETLKESNYKKIDLDKSEEWTNTVDFTNNLFLTDYDLSNKDVDLYIVNRAGKIYILNYLTKNSNKTSRVYNINLPVGQYVLFIKIDDKLYRTNKVYQF